MLITWWVAQALGWHGLGLSLIEATAARALLFDICSSLSQSCSKHREGWAAEPLFKVGTVAVLDKALRWLATRLNWSLERLRLVWVGSLVTAGTILYL